MDLNLQNKTVIVSRIAGRLDESLIQMLAAESAVTVVIDNEAGELKMNEAFTSSGVKYLKIAGDLSYPQSCKAAIEKILERTNSIYGLINTMSGYNNPALETASNEQFMASLHNILVPHYLLVQHALPALKLSGGTIVNSISNNADTGDGGSVYAAVNDGIKALTREWAVDLLKYHIRVNAVLAEKLNEEAANTITFLLSDKSSHTTGQVIHCR
jgi:NAD(P)-dependent dehydrogenase (short-subunit alcohol dehydrogenase family)